ncbi:CBS domain-containing protein [Actinoplanes awajinensis]|uniref:CBS domain-containing protein n=1 Tax=Actinoplanes awajinensis TaxID=135946 RepID=UPI0009FE1916|nr:CBS domain-containing protein [Actinoplanes awajinensis]
MSPQTRLPDAGEPGFDLHESTFDLHESTTGTETTVREVMLRHPKTLPADASIVHARAALHNDHVHLVLLTEGRRLAGTLTRTDLPPPGTLGPALAWSTLVDRTVSPDTPTAVVHGLMISRGSRRAAVVTADGSLVGLMCLKQRRTGFCSDADVAARSRDLP